MKDMTLVKTFYASKCIKNLHSKAQLKSTKVTEEIGDTSIGGLKMLASVVLAQESKHDSTINNLTQCVLKITI